MIKFMKNYWFEFLLGLCVLVFLLFSIVVATAPHNDAKGRGFTKCTLQMGLELQQTGKLSVMGAVKMVSKGYWCYALVMGEGVKLFVKGEQPAPWSNYLFEEERPMYQDDEGEGFSEDLLKANLLDEGDDKKTLWEESDKENDDEE